VSTAAPADDAPAVSLRLRLIGDVVAAWLEPVEEPLSSSDGDDDDVVPAEMAGDDAAVVRHMARVARRRLAREEREQSRLERERAQEARIRREIQARDKAERERADRDRADRARAERTEQKAALEAQKALRRERERALRAEREAARQEREAAAREHFLLLQRKRRLLAEQARQAQLAQQAHLVASRQPALYDSLAASWNGGAGASFASTGSNASALADVAHAQDRAAELAPPARGLLLDVLDDLAAAAHASFGSSGPDPSLARPLSEPDTAAAAQRWTSQGSVDSAPAPEHALSHRSVDADAADAAAGARPSLFSDLGGATWLADQAARAAVREVQQQQSMQLNSSIDGAPTSGLLWGSAAGSARHYGDSEGGASLLWQSTAPIAGGIAALQAPPSQQQAPPSQQQACKYHAQGFCREGDACRFSHAPPPPPPPQPPTSGGGGLLLHAPGFAFGAPGSREFGGRSEFEFGTDLHGGAARWVATVAAP
jgi:hypothetical protein